MCDSPRELHPSPFPNRSSGGAATRFAKKPVPLRIVVPPTEYCPFSTDLILPITPPSLPTPVSSSCFTSSDMQELASQDMSVPLIPAPDLLSCSRNTVVSDFASPTSSQFLLMPPTPHLEEVVGKTAICVSPLATPADDMRTSGSNGTRSENPRPWEVSSTWLSDLGGHTETDRIFRHNFLETASLVTESSPASTPALSPSATSPSSQVSSPLAPNLPNSLVSSPAPSPLAPSSHPHTMPPRSSPIHLTLKPTGTDTFPSTLDGLQAWRESVTSGLPQPEEPRSLIRDVRNSCPEQPRLGTTTYPSMPHHPTQSSRPHISETQTFLKRAKVFGGRVKQLVLRKKHRGSMDNDVSLRIDTSQDSENGSVILITAPPPPYDVRSFTLIPHSHSPPEQVRSRTVSEYSSVVQASMVEVAATVVAESGCREGVRNRSALRRLSLAALSTIKRS